MPVWVGSAQTWSYPSLRVQCSEPLSAREYCDQKKNYGSRFLLGRRRPSSASVGHVLHQEHLGQIGSPGCPLPAPMLMFPRPYEEAAKRLKALACAPFEGGCTLDYACVTLPFLTLVLLRSLTFGHKLIETGRELPLRWLDRGESVTLVAPYESSM